MNITKVENMRSESSGQEVANQFIIHTKNGQYFQSYRTIIAFWPNDGSAIQLDKQSWNYSTTTGRYRNQFLREKKPETLKKIKSGEYELVDLN